LYPDLAMNNNMQKHKH